MKKKRDIAIALPMKALSLTQPWATLIAIGAKKIETRSWSTPYRGPLAIHATKNYPIEAKAMTLLTPFYEVLDKAGLMPATLPTGCVVATCILKDVILIDENTELPEEPEKSFGDYSVGRYMWILEDIQRLARLIPAKGAQGLWTWESQ